VLRCVLWDFGDTIADERWMLTPLTGVSDWPRAWSEVAGELGDPWNRGEIPGDDVYREVATRLGVEKTRVVEHVERCCRSIRFFEGVMDVARKSRLHQSIVTVNPDGFSQFVVPHYRLGDLFVPIVTSWQEHTLDKGVMGRLALERLALDISPDETILLDNKEHNLVAWEAEGGKTYLFTTEKQFLRDLDGPLAELAASCT
jgi:hypothetical protein